MFDAATSWLFGPPGLTPHGFCLLWRPGLLWLHALSDLGTGLAYLTIPLSLATIVRRRPDLVLRPVVMLFAAFILFCGVGHWFALLTLWVPAYGMEGVVKAATALASIASAIALRWVLPGILALPSPMQFQKVSASLEQVSEAGRALATVADEATEARDKLAGELARREAAEQELQASESRYRAQAEALQEAWARLGLATDRAGIGIWDLDLVNDKLVWDSWMYRLYGMEPRQDMDASELWQRHIHPDDRAAVEHAVSVALEGGEPVDAGYRIIWSDGTVHHIASSAPRVIRDGNGRAVRMVGTNMDVSERQIEALQRAIMVEAAPNGMMIVDEAGTITLANSQAEKMFDYPAGGLRGQPVEILVPDGFRDSHRAHRSAFTSAISDRMMARGQDFIGRRRDGGPVTLEVMLNPVSTPRGRITVVSLLDSTERKRKVEAQLEAERQNRLTVEAANADLERLSHNLAEARDKADQANRAKSRFLAGMSHELRTPLNGILGYAQLLQMEGGLSAAQGSRVDSMVKAGNHLLQMITCVLDLSELESAHVELQAVRFDARSVAEACLDLIRPMAEAKGLSLSMATAAGVGRELVADPTRFRQVLLNLLGNAAKFTATGTIALRLRLTTDGSALRVEVADTGVGIPAEQRPRLFKEFERLDNAATRRAQGSGLGLALSSRLADLMGGRLGHEDNPAGGSVFWLELPLDTPESSDPDLALVPDADPVVLPLRILVVDDVLMNRDIAEAFLRSAGHQVTSTDEGAEAVALATRGDFDVIVMDVRMPGMDGLEATRRIRSLDGARGQVPIVALTAHAFSEQIKQCQDAGMDGHLAKPFDMAALLSAVGRAVASRRKSNSRSGAERAKDPLPAPPAIQPMVPILNRDRFEQTTAFLPPEKVASYLRLITDRVQSLLHDLDETDAVAHHRKELADTAHALAGTAGMFGFESLAAAGRSFERAALSDAAEASPLAIELRTALEATLKEIAGACATAASL
jgi:PAS domain S-box-containing protein